MEAVNKRMEQMKGREFNFRSNQVTFIGYLEQENQYIISTSLKQYPVDKDQLKNFLADFLPIGQGVQVQVNNRISLPERQISGDVIASVKDTLLDNIKRVQDSKDYIPQAAEINSQVKSLIDLAKSEIDMFKIIVAAQTGKS